MINGAKADNPIHPSGSFGSAQVHPWRVGHRILRYKIMSVSYKCFFYRRVIIHYIAFTMLDKFIFVRSENQQG